MDKTAIKNFAIFARNKLISDITDKAGLLGITKDGISKPLPTSTKDIQFFDIGNQDPWQITGNEILQRNALVRHIENKEEELGFEEAFKYIIEETAYTWFNRLIAIRFMEVNDYLPSGIPVLSSITDNKFEPDIVTTPFDTDIIFSNDDKDKIIALKNDNKMDELFRFLFIKQCNKLNDILPHLFQKTNNYTEILLNINFTDKDGVVRKLISDIDEKDFEEAVEIIGWLYQYYNEKEKNKVINIYKGTIKKEDIPAATQLFTTDWVVRYMVDNSLGRYWIERNPNSTLYKNLNFYISSKNNQNIFVNEKTIPEDLTFFDPCMGSGHILVYAFDVLMKIYRECGFTDKEAVVSILKNNLYGLDIDERAYQLAYFAIMMKARSYDKRFFNRKDKSEPKVYPIYEFTQNIMVDNEELNYLANEFKNAKQYGSLMNLKKDFDIDKAKQYLNEIQGQLTLDTMYIEIFNNIVLNAEILLNKYAIVCTNPPYLNKMNGLLKKYINKNYKDYKGDLFSVFIYKNFDFCIPNGYSAFMTPLVWMYIKTYEKLRTYILQNKSIVSLIEMEYSAFEEATVPICTFVLKNKKENNKGLYLKLSDFKGGMEIQKQKVLGGLKDNTCDYFYETNQDNFSKIPGTPIAYWVSDKVLDIFETGKRMDEVAKPKQGLATACNDKFLRFWYEVDNNRTYYNATSIDDSIESGKKWFPYNKGGKYRKWFGNNDYLVDWENDGKAIRNFKDDKGKVRSVTRNPSYYFKECFTWSLVSSGTMAFRYKSNGFIFDVAGMSCFSNEYLHYLLALCNTPIVVKNLEILAPTINYQVGDIANIPVIFNEEKNDLIENLVKQNIDLSKNDWDNFETSWDFKTSPLLSQQAQSIEEAYNIYKNATERNFIQLKENEEELNRLFIEIYGLEDELTPEVSNKDVTIHRIFDDKKDFPEDMTGSKYLLTKSDVIKNFISYAVGCMFGRYSLDIDGLAYAGGDFDINNYKTFIPDMDNCIPITDAEYFKDDIVGLFIAFVKKSFGEDKLEENLEFIGSVLGTKGITPSEQIRTYFIKDFYKDHVKKYKNCPIYWLYDSGKQNGFKALIYMHRYNKDTTGLVRVNYLHNIQKIYSNRLDDLNNTIDFSNNTKEVALCKKEKEKLIKQSQETKEYDEILAHVGNSRIGIDLDNGVKVNYTKVQTDANGKKYEILKKIK